MHIITNDIGQIVDFILTPGNVDDRKPLKIERFIRRLWGKIFGDKGYIGMELFKDLVSKGLT